LSTSMSHPPHYKDLETELRGKRIPGGSFIFQPKAQPAASTTQITIATEHDRPEKTVSQSLA